MAVNTSPLPNHWYMNQSGKLIKVRLLSYTDGELTGVLLEFLEGATMRVSAEEWYKLDLTNHAWTASGRQATV